MLVIRDITERERVRVDLEERARALASTNADLKTFTAAAVHDMKEPLRQIRAFASLLAESDTEFDPVAARYIRFMGESAGRLTRLVDDLLE